MPKGYSHLTREQRNHIRRYHGIMPVQQIADNLCVHRSTVYRELKRNSDGNGRYEVDTAHRRACERRSCASLQPRKIPPDFIDRFVFHRLENRHSPDVIANTLPPSAPSISTRWLYELIDRAIRLGDPDLADLLRRKYQRKSPLKRYANAGVHIIPNRVDISQRPKEVETRKTFGHWEADTIIGAHHQGALVTVVERKTRMLVCAAVNRRTKKAVANGIIEAMKDISQGVQTITFDNGGEFADHERIAQQLGCKTYFARPYRSYERGSNENVNGQVRWYYPKGESLRDVEPFFLKVNIEHLNSIPRRILNFDSPQILFDQELAALKKPDTS